MKSLIALLSVVCLTGCMTGGPVIGPFSNWAAGHNEKVMYSRAIHVSPNIPQEKKEQLFKVVQFGGDPRTCAVGIGVDIGTLADGGYSWAEAGKSLLGCVGDLLLYGGAAKGASSLLTKGSDSGDRGNLTINGNVYDSQIQVYQGNNATSANGQNKPYIVKNKIR